MHLDGGGACNLRNRFERRKLGKLAEETEKRSYLRSVCGSACCVSKVSSQRVVKSVGIV
jgi:hypothetical protein